MDPIELDISTGTRIDSPDRRPRMEQPPPVGIIAVADVRLPATRGMEQLLDDFYVGILQFAKDAGGEQLTYRADNFCLHFDWHEGLVDRISLRPVGIQVESLGALVQKLMDREIDFQFEKGLTPGNQNVWVYDPAGNALQIYERRMVG